MMPDTALPIKTRRRVLVALIWMIGGSSLVLALLVIMNAYIETPTPGETATPSRFAVERPKPEQTRKPRPRREKPRDTPRRAAPPAAPLLSAGLSGMNFGLPAYDASELGAMDDAILGSTRDVVMTEESVDTPPKVRQRTEVEYPRRAREKGITGYVVLSLLINTGGEVERVKVLESQPAGVFEEAALAAVNGWRFDPATYKGNPVKLWAKQTLRFDLK